MNAVVHIAGQVEAGIQLCSRCGLVLVDWRGAMSTDGRMSFWAVGRMVATAGHCWCVRTGTLEENEIPCGRVQ